MALYTCPRCNGKGEVSFRHVANGKCFACWGAGKLSATAKSLSEAERAGMMVTQMRAEEEARACSDAQNRAIAKIAMRLHTSPGALVATANGMRAGYHDAEFTKQAVSNAIAMFGGADMTTAKAKRLCYPRAVA